MTELFTAVILAGGLATRLRPLTETTPKSMLLFANEPFIAHQLRLLKQKQIKRVVICAGFLSDTICEFVQNGKQFGLHVDYSFDGEHLLGTGGAIKKALPLLEDNFFVLYGDSFLPCDYAFVQQQFLKEDKNVLMTIYKNNNAFDKSNVSYVDNRIITYNKEKKTEDMQHIDYGLGVFSQQAFTSVKENNFDLALIYQQALKKMQLAACLMHERFYEIGSQQGIKDFAAYVSK